VVLVESMKKKRKEERMRKIKLMILRIVDDYRIERNGTPPYVNSIQLQA